MSSSVDKTYLRKAVRGRIVTSVVVIALIAGMAAMVVWHVSDIVRGATTNYVQVTGDVIDEGEERVREGGRRSKHWATYRTVEIEFSINGSTESDSIRSEDLAVGEQVDVWVGPKGDGHEVFLSKPAPADVFAYVWAALWLLLAAASFWGLIRAMKRTAAIGSFDPQGRQPDMWFTIEEIKNDPVVRKNAAPIMKLIGYTQTQNEAQPAKASLTLKPSSTPRVQFATQLPLFAVRDGEKNGPVVIYAQAENVFFAGDLVHEVVVP